MTKQNDHEQYDIPRRKLAQGSIKGRYPVILSDGRTIVYVKDGRKRLEVKEKYEKHLGI